MAIVKQPNYMSQHLRIKSQMIRYKNATGCDHLTFQFIQCQVDYDYLGFENFHPYAQNFPPQNFISLHTSIFTLVKNLNHYPRLKGLINFPAPLITFDTFQLLSVIIG